MNNEYMASTIDGDLKEVKLGIDIEDQNIIEEVRKNRRKFFEKEEYVYFIDRIIEKMTSTGSRSLLDIGCGKCSVTGRFKNKWDKIVGVDLNEDDIKIAKNFYNEVFNIDAVEVLKYFGEKSFDAVIALDFIEHITKDESLQLIKDCEKIAKNFVAFFFPLEAMKDNLRVDDRKYESLMKHKCQWEEEEFIKMGYKTYFYGGPFYHILAIKDLK